MEKDISILFCGASMWVTLTDKFQFSDNMPVIYLLSGKADVKFLISLCFCFEEYYREALKVVREENQKLFDRHMKLLSEEALKVFFLLF